MATNILMFPGSRTTGTLPANAIDTPRYATATPLATATLPPRRGHLALVGSEGFTAGEHESTQARADRIVAQVEREVAALAERQASMRFQAKPSTLAPVHSIERPETPASVARRLFHALLDFARPA